jgi:thiamine-monophosphate kinase
VDAAAIPVAPQMTEWLSAEGIDPVELALRGGDDFELMFTARPRQAGRLRAVRRHLGDLPITRIGTVTRSPRLLVKDSRGQRELPEGYQHFR